MYIYGPLEDVKGPGQWPEVQQALRDLEQAAIARAAIVWPGAVPGGLLPVGDQFGIIPLRKNDMAVDTTTATASGSYSFRRNALATGWADLFNYTVRDNMIHAFAGFLIADEILKLSQLRMELGQVRFAIWDIQEGQRYDKFAIVLKSDKGKELIADPLTRVLVRGFIESTGVQRIVPLGFTLYRRPDLVLTET